MVKISNLPDGGDQESGDVLPGVRGGTTRKVSGPLVQSDLAANGGTIPEVDRDEEITGTYRFDGGQRSFETENKSGGSPRLWVFRHQDDGEFRIERRHSDGSFQYVEFRIDPDGGLVPQGLDAMGEGTLNFEEVYEDGNRVLAEDSLAANGGPLPEVDRTNIFTADQRISNTSPGIEFEETDTTDQNWFLVANEGDLQFQTRDDGFGSGNIVVRILNDGAVRVGSVNPQGFGTVSAEELYDNNNRVLAPGNTAGGALPTSDPAVAGRLYADSADGYTVKVSQG